MKFQSIFLNFAIFLIAAATPNFAEACVSPHYQTPIIRYASSQIPENAVEAEVFITEVERYVTKAEILAVLKGNFSERNVLIDRTYRDSCTIWPKAGQRGIIVFRVLSNENNIPIVQAIPPKVKPFPPFAAQRTLAKISLGLIIIGCVAFVLIMRGRSQRLRREFGN